VAGSNDAGSAVAPEATTAALRAVVARLALGVDSKELPRIRVGAVLALKTNNCHTNEPVTFWAVIAVDFTPLEEITASTLVDASLTPALE
jgi:hypothetical protein